MVGAPLPREEAEGTVPRGAQTSGATSFASSSLPAGHHNKHIRSVENRTRVARSGGSGMASARERSESVGRGRRRGSRRRRVGSHVGGVAAREGRVR
jgi:hypothetical protein